MSKNIAQRRKRLATLVTQTLEVYRRDVPRFDEWVVLINKRTDKIFEMLTYILSQKDPKIPNSLKPDILKCVTCIDGIKRLYLQHDSKNKILLRGIRLHNSEREVVHLVLPDETLIIDKSRFDSAVFEKRYEVPYIADYLFKEGLQGLEPIDFDIKSIPSDFFSFQILESKKILIQQPFRDYRQTLVNIDEIDTLVCPMIKIEHISASSLSSIIYPLSFLFVLANSFEENILNGNRWQFYSVPSFSKMHDRVEHIIKTYHQQVFNIHYYLNNPEFLVKMYIKLKPAPVPYLINTLLSDILSYVRLNPIILSKVELSVDERFLSTLYPLSKSEVWRF